MKILQLALILLFIFGCEDQVSENTVEYIDRPTACPPGNPENEESEFQFAGIQKITDVNRTSATVHWEANSNFNQYFIISVTPSSRKVIKTVDGKDSITTVKGLVPNTNYTLMVRGIDGSGFLETNSQKISFKTLPWPNYANLKSLRFNGAQAVTLGESKNFELTESFTISFWLKDSIASIGDERVFTIHHGNKAGSLLSIGVDQDKLKLFYRDKNQNLREFAHSFDYANSVWHHIAVVYDKTYLYTYLDGQLAFKIKDQLSQQKGKHPAHIGSYSGIQKGLSASLDEFGFYQKYFNSLDVEELFNQGKANDLRDHTYGLTLAHWYRFGDHAQDSESNIEDTIGNLNGSPFNINIGDFSNDSP